MAVDITTIGIEYDTSGLEKGTRAQDKTTQSANKMADSLGGAEKSTKAVTQATNYYTTALQAAAAAMGISKIIDQIDQYTKFTSQLKLATGSTAEYAASLNAVRQISKDAQSSLAGTGTLYAKITTGTRELGIAQSQVAKITESINLSLKVSGATAAESASAQLQLAQAFASGTLRGEEFNAVNEAAPRLMKALADGMGRPVGALKDMASNGLITSEIMANVLPKALEQLREEAKQVQTISGAFQVLKNNVMEFIGTQSQASGVVSVITGAIGLLADNLVILAGAIVTITATKFANFLSGLAVSAYESVAANRALAAANLATAQSNVAATASTLALADARVIELRQAVLAASGEAALAVTMNGLIPAQARATAASLAHTEALAAQTVAVGAASAGAGILRGALAFLGGPIGLIVTALGVAATAWSVFGDKAEEANDKTTKSTIESSQEVIARLDQEISKLKDRNKLRSENPELAKGSSEANLKALTQAQKDYKDALAGTGKAAGLNATAQAEMVKVLGQAYGQIYQRVNEVNSETKKLTEGTTSEKMKKWLGENGSAAQRMAAAMAEAKKEVGVLTPEMEKLIKAKFADKSISKEAAFEESARHKMYLAHVKAEQSIQDQINKDAKQFASDQIARTKEVTKEIIAGINEQSKAFLSYNKSLDDHAQRMSDMNTLAQLEIDTLGMSSVQRNTLIEQKKIELALEKQLKDIRASNMAQGEKDLLEEKAKTQANIDKSTAELRAQQNEWSKFYGEIYNGLSDSLYRGFEAGKGFGRSFLDSLKNLFKTNIIKIAVQAVMGTGSSIVSSLAGAASGSGGGSSSLLSMGKTLWDGFSAAGTVGGGVVTLGNALGSSTVSAFGSGMSLSSSQAASAAAAYNGAGMTGTGTAISAGQSVGAALPIVGWVLAGMAANNSLYDKGWGGKATDETKQYGIASGMVGGALKETIQKWFGLSDKNASMFSGAAVVNRLFGHKLPELQQSELTGSFGSGGYSASTRDVFKAKGGVFRGDKWSESVNAMADTKGMTDAFAMIKTAAASYADVLGLSSTALDTYTKSFKVNLSITGDAAKDAEANQKIMTGIITSMTDEISNMLVPSLSKFAKEGESASATLQRLATGLSDVNLIMRSVGLDEFAKSLEGSNAATRLAELTGGIEKLATGAQYFFENFLSDAEKIKPSMDLVSSTMKGLGQSSVDTIDEFKNLVQGLDLATESGAKMYAELIAIAPQFKAVADYTSEMTKAADDLSISLVFRNQALQAERQSAIETTEALDNANKSREDYIDKLTKGAEKALQILSNSVNEAKKQAQSALDATIGIINAKRSAEMTYFETQKTLLNASLSGARSLSNALFSEANRIAGYASKMTLQGAPNSAFSAQAKLAGGDTSDAVLSAATSIAPDMFASWSDYAINFFKTKSAIESAGTAAYSKASEQSAQVILMESQLMTLEKTHNLELDFYTKSEKMAREVFDREIVHYDSVIQLAQDNLAEVTGTKLAVLSLGDAMSGFSGALSKLASYTGRQLEPRAEITARPTEKAATAQVTELDAKTTTVQANADMKILLAQLIDASSQQIAILSSIDTNTLR